MEKIKLTNSEMEILLAAKSGGIDKVKKTIFKIVYGVENVDYQDRNTTLIYWLEKTIHSITSQQHKQYVEIDISLSDYLIYIDSYKYLYRIDIDLYEGVILYLVGKLRNCRFRINNEDIFEIAE